nr:immunoglobulin light chain junction region [Mus musculus]NSL97543.1 immunoglobulin light chain junction region [Mus musculus]NSL97804.1 immunoglobulin light chain junction region [Mus musculus]NSL97822.1 immunoglobulin light chain junction region [Mus musculus]NSL98230.1 immunoglobulin light chain junction region [Mus musculus]
CWQGTHFPHTF